MLKSLKVINNLVANANPNDYDSISYNKYYRDLSTISNTVLEDAEAFKIKEMKIMAELHNLPESAAKQNIIRIIQGLEITGSSIAS
jgi:hypothetical protein